MKNPLKYFAHWLKEFFENDETVDYGIGATGAIFWLFIYSTMRAVAPLSGFAVLLIALSIFVAVVMAMKMMEKYPRTFIIFMLLVFMAFTYIQAGLSHVA